MQGRFRRLVRLVRRDAVFDRRRKRERLEGAPRLAPRLHREVERRAREVLSADHRPHGTRVRIDRDQRDIRIADASEHAGNGLIGCVLQTGIECRSDGEPASVQRILSFLLGRAESGIGQHLVFDVLDEVGSVRVRRQRARAQRKRR